MMFIPLTIESTCTDVIPTPAPSVRGKNLDAGLIDSHGRQIRDLRLSLTDRCNFRCVYCMDPDTRFRPKEDLLTAREAIEISSVCIGLGVRRIRLTGGEPTLRPDLAEIIAGIRHIGVDDIALTTNGALLDRGMAQRLHEAGLDRITVSLDSIRNDRFETLTRSSTSAGTVIDAIRIARDEGLDPVRVNAVVVRGFNDDEVLPLASLARELGVDMRFIEYMPLDSARAWEKEKLVPAAEMLELIQQEHRLVDIARDRTSSPARVFEFADGSPGRIGMIASVTEPFCGACSRLRVTADGKLRPCLFSLAEWDVLGPMRQGAGASEIQSIIRRAVAAKEAGHQIASEQFVQPARPMSSIGG